MKLRERIDYIKIFSEDIPIIQVLNILMNYSSIASLKTKIENCTQIESVIINSFFIFICNDKSIVQQNNHYFMDALLKDLRSQNYSGIDFASCYNNLSNTNKNDSQKNKNSLNNMKDYIDNNLNIYINDFTSIPKTTFMSSFTEKLIGVSNIENNYLSISREKDKGENNGKIFARFLSLSLVRNPEILRMSLMYFTLYNANINNLSLYDYYVFKFIYHLNTYTDYYKNIFKIKKEYDFKVINVEKDIITSDNLVYIIHKKGEEPSYLMYLNSKSMVFFYSKEKNKINNISTELVEKYEKDAVLFHSECIFFPTDRLLEVKNMLLSDIKIFQGNVFNAINPYRIWRVCILKIAIEEIVFFDMVKIKKWLEFTNNSTEIDNLFDSYFFRRFKKNSQKIEKKIKK